jgi:hypothetical protein
MKTLLVTLGSALLLPAIAAAAPPTPVQTPVQALKAVQAPTQAPVQAPKTAAVAEPAVRAYSYQPATTTAPAPFSSDWFQPTGTRRSYQSAANKALGRVN